MHRMKKRRVIYTTDDEWNMLKRMATLGDTTISQVIIRVFERNGAILTMPVGALRPQSTTDTPDRKSAQAERDAILRRINKTGKER